MLARWRLFGVEMKCWLGCAVLAAGLAGCNSNPPPTEPEAVKSELKQLEEMREKERMNK